MRKKLSTLVLSLSLIGPLSTLAQSTVKKVLYLGNSYTGVNNLPQLTADLADSAGDSLIFDSNTPGGYTLEGHSTNASTLAKIAQGDWDRVVLQEQSQRPSFPLSQVQVEVFPYAAFLDSVVHADNPCAKTMFYMTWGRESGDAGNCGVWPPVCTYEGMDSLLRLRYQMMADDNEGEVSPVGPVWKYLRENHPTIDLYAADGSHPSAAGSYAAACAFYTAIFRKDPSLITDDYTLTAGDAAIIRGAAKLVAFDSLDTWNIGEFDLASDFSFAQTTGYDYQFNNQSVGASGYLWDMGDGTNYSSSDPDHTFAGAGTYTVTLSAFDGCDTVSSTQVVSVNPVSGIWEENREELLLYPNPASLSVELNWSWEHGPCRMSLVDAEGKVVLSIERWSGELIDVSGLAQGVYTVLLNGGERSMKLSVQR